MSDAYYKELAKQYRALGKPVPDEIKEQVREAEAMKCRVCGHKVSLQLSAGTFRWVTDDNPNSWKCGNVAFRHHQPEQPTPPLSQKKRKK